VHILRWSVRSRRVQQHWEVLEGEPSSSGVLATRCLAKSSHVDSCDRGQGTELGAGKQQGPLHRSLKLGFLLLLLLLLLLKVFDVTDVLTAGPKGLPQAPVPAYPEDSTLLARHGAISGPPLKNSHDCGVCRLESNAVALGGPYLDSHGPATDLVRRNGRSAAAQLRLD
jgi:hypothetical protein